MTRARPFGRTGSGGGLESGAGVDFLEIDGPGYPKTERSRRGS